MEVTNYTLAKSCSICGSDNVHLKYPRQKESPEIALGAFSPTARDFGIFHDLHQCEDCKHIFAQLSNIDINHQYEEAEDPGSYLFQWQDRIENLASLFRKVIPFLGCTNPNILDIGAGGGIFLSLLKRLGLRGVGLEPSTQLVKLGKEKFALTCIRGL